MEDNYIYIDEEGRCGPVQDTRREAAERLMEQYGDDVIRLCFVYLRDWHLAQDACQETFFRAWRYYDTFRRESGEKTWLFRIAVSACRDMKRTAWYKQGAQAAPIEEERLGDQGLPEPPGPVTECVLALPEKYRLPLLHYYHGMKATRIAQVMNMPYATALTRLHRGRELVKKAMEGGANHEA